MQSAQQSTQYERYAQNAAWQLVRSGLIPHCDREDCVSELQLHALVAAQRFQKRYAGDLNAQEKYVWRALANRYRDLKKHFRLQSYGPVNRWVDPDAVTDRRTVPSPEARTEAVEMVRYLRKTLTPREWEVLVSSVHWGDVSGRDRASLARVRKKARCFCKHA